MIKVWPLIERTVLCLLKVFLALLEPKRAWLNQLFYHSGSLSNVPEEKMEQIWPMVTTERLEIPAKSGIVTYWKAVHFVNLKKESYFIFEPCSKLPKGIFIENCYLTNVDEQTPILIVHKLNKAILLPRNLVAGKIEEESKRIPISAILSLVKTKENNEVIPTEEIDVTSDKIYLLFDFENLSEKRLIN